MQRWGRDKEQEKRLKTQESARWKGCWGVPSKGPANAKAQRPKRTRGVLGMCSKFVCAFLCPALVPVKLLWGPASGFQQDSANGRQPQQRGRRKEKLPCDRPQPCCGLLSPALALLGCVMHFLPFPQPLPGLGVGNLLVSASSSPSRVSPHPLLWKSTSSSSLKLFYWNHQGEFCFQPKP